MFGRTLLTTDGVDVSEFDIGSFGNKQTDAVGANLLKLMLEKFTCSIRQLTGTRAKEVQAHRFLENKNVTINAMNTSFLTKTNENCAGIEHALYIMDTVSIGFPTQEIIKQEFGPTTHENTQGFHIHASILLNAENKQVLGVGHLNPWTRDKANEKSIQDNRLLEDKESFKWQYSADESLKHLTNPKKITFVSDRENDIFSLFEYITEHKKDFIIRAKHDRKLMDGNSISGRFQYCCRVKQNRFALLFP